MTANVENLFRVVQTLSPAEQLELIQAISHSLQQQYYQSNPDAIPQSVKRTAPVTDLSQLAADFWPQDESAEDINTFIAQQRLEDRVNTP